MKKLLLFFACIVFVPAIAHAANDHLVINQIQTTGGPGLTANDYIEIYNPTASSIDLQGMRLVKRTATGDSDTLIKSWTDSTIIPAGGYYLWANSDYTAIAVTPDVTTSATIADDNGIALRAGPNDTGTIIDSAAWGNATNAFVETSAFATNPSVGQVLARTNGLDTNDNSQDFSIQSPPPQPLADSPAPQNEDSGNQQQPQDQNSNPPTQDSNPQPQSSGGGGAPAYSSQVLISELLPNPAGADSGKEWVELFNNSGSAVDLSDWILDDESADGSVGLSAYTIPSGTVIAANNYLAIDIPAGNFALDNTGGDSLRLIWPDKTLAQTISYAVTTPQDTSYARNADGGYAWTTILTKGAANLFSVTEASTDDNSEDNLDAPDSTVDPINQDVVVKNATATDFANAKIALSELYPNPPGDDAGAEWIELANNGTDVVSLRNWILDDGQVAAPIGSTAYHIQSSTIQPGELVALQIPKNKFAMNNTGTETVRLFDPNSKLVDSVTFSGTKEGLSYAKVGDTWVWTSPTPSDINANSTDAVVDKSGKVEGATLVRTGNPDPQSDSNPMLYYFAAFIIIWYIVGRLLGIKDSNS